MKILHVLPSVAAELGGPPVSVVNLCTSLNAMGNTSTIYCTDLATAPQARRRRGGMTEADWANGVENVEINLSRAIPPLRLAFSPELAWRLFRDVKQFDIVHIHSLFLFPQAAAYWVATLRDVPYVVSPRGALDPHLQVRGKIRKRIVERLWQRKMIDSASALHLTSTDELRGIRQLNIQSATTIIPNGVDVQGISNFRSRHNFRDRYLDGYRGKLVVNHGRIAAKKGLDILLEAVLMDSDVTLVLVGSDEGGTSSQLAARAHSAGASGRLRIFPPLPQTEIWEAVDACDVWALPSHSENFGMAVVEAMARGKPVVSSPHVNIAPSASSAQALLMVDNTPIAFHSAIRTVVDNTDLAASLGDNARKFVRQYDRDEVAVRYLALYQSVLEGRSSHREFRKQGIR